MADFRVTLISDTLASISKELGRPLTSAESDDITQRITTALDNANDRRKAIRSSPEAAGRAHMAEHLAEYTDVSATDAIMILAAAPLEGADSKPTPFSQFMDRDQQPGVGAMPAGNAQSSSDDDRFADRTIEMCRRLGLRGFAKRG